MRALAVCTAAALALVVAAATPAEAAAARTTRPNLIRNGNGEAAAGATDGSTVPVPSWTIATGTGFTANQYGASGGFPAASDPGPARRGSNFLAGGPSDGVSVATQTRPLGRDRAAIDAGKAKFRLSGFLGGYESQADNAVLEVDWLSGSGRVLGTTAIGPVTPVDRADLTGLLKRSAHGFVPARSRQALITLTLTRAVGAYNDGYADNLSLRLTTPAAG